MAGRNDNRDVRGDVRGEIREFLSTRRAKISPEQAGLPVYGGDRRRVSGLRREEVALLAGISSEYYTRLERGNATGVSDSVIDAIAHALQLDEAERAHLLDLLRTAGTTRPPRRRPARQRVRPTVQRVLDSMVATPAFVLNGRLDILAANDLGVALFSPIYADPVRPPNNARFLFLDPHATEFFCDWDKVANDTVALLRAEAGRDRYDRQLSDLIGELSTRSDEFRVRWAAHHVRIHTSGVKRLHHPVVGDLELAFESFPLAADPGQSLLTYTAESGSPSQEPSACWPAGPRPPTTSGSLRRLTTPSRLSRSRCLTDRVIVDEPQRVDQQASSTLPDLLDHPFDHPDDPTGSIWIHLDRRGIQPEQARSVWSRPVRRGAPGYGSGGWGPNLG
jgi:transcriptional regulator with XRE-family HTH domain